MPKAPRSQEDREIIRERILDQALTLISEQGFSAFSMRKLASRLGLTATTIYHYYSSKDELYLMILTRGFEFLHERFFKIFGSGDPPALKLKKMIESYIDFGINKAHYYNIMFTSDAPKYRDYVGTEIEPVAFLEKQTALKLVDITSKAIRDVARNTSLVSDKEIHRSVIKTWSTLHGILSLYNSRVLPEVDENPERIIEGIAGDLLESILSYAENKAT